MTRRRLSFVAGVSLFALLVLCVLWEGWLAPLRPGGSWMILKAVPLLAPLSGILRGRRYTSQWASMLSLLYLAEGVLRANDPAPVAVLARLEAGLALALFVATVLHARVTAPSRQRQG